MHNNPIWRCVQGSVKDHFISDTQGLWSTVIWGPVFLNTSRLSQNTRCFVDVIFKCIYWMKIWSPYFNSKFTEVCRPKFPIQNKSALVYIMVWRRPTIISNNNGKSYWRLHVSLALNVSNLTCIPNLRTFSTRTLCQLLNNIFFFTQIIATISMYPQTRFTLPLKNLANFYHIWLLCVTASLT